MEKSQQLIKLIRVRLSLFVVLLVGSLVGTAWYLEDTISARLHDSKILNVAGKQRALTQKIARILSSPYSIEARLTLRKTTTEYLDNQDYLNAAHNEHMDEVIARVYNQGTPSVNAFVTANAQTALALFTDAFQVEEAEKLVPTLNLTFTLLDTAVFELQTASADRTKQILNVISSIVTVLLICTALLIFTIYRPMEKRIFAHLNDTARRKQNDRNLLESFPDAIVRIDRHNKVTYFSRNAELLWGFNAKDVIGQNVLMLVPDAIKPHHDSYIDKHRETGKNRIIGASREVEIATKNEERKYCVLYISQSKDEIGENIYTAFIRDVTEQKRKAKELDAAKTIASVKTRLASVGELAAGIAHEINNPLGVIMGRVGLMQMQSNDQTLSQAFISESLDVINAQSERISSIVKSMSAMTRVGDKSIDYQPEDVAIICKQTIELVLQARRHLHVNVAFIQPDFDCLALVEPVGFQQALVNLINNAIDATLEANKDDETRVTISIEKNSPYLVIHIEDNGVGIDAADIDAVFQPLYTTKAAGKGSGLGLTIVKRVIESMEGKVSVKRARERGVVFSLEVMASSE